MTTTPSLHVIEDGAIFTVMHGSAPATGLREAVLHDGELLGHVREVLQHELAPQYLDPFAPAEERTRAVCAVLRAAISRDQLGSGPLAGVPSDTETLIALFDATLGWGPAQKYLNDPRVQEIKIDDTTILVQEAGSGFVRVPETFASAQEVIARAAHLAALRNIKLDSANPQQTLPLDYGTRMHVTIPPRVPEGQTLVCIRRGRSEAWDLDTVLRSGTLNAAVADLLRLLVTARCSFLIAGSTGSGKTTLLEALVNSLPGEPHVITIEDNALEIGVRSPIWTRQLVNTSMEPGAFGRVAKEVLRQTPDLVVPGEIRREEAGAFLYLVKSDHPTLTTIHACSCQEALERFAYLASMRGADLYEGREDAALRDACSGFDVVIHMQSWGGRRFVREVGLTHGVTVDSLGQTRPLVIPLATQDVDAAGQVVWQVHARIVDGLLVWTKIDDPRVSTPLRLHERLQMARAQGTVRAAATTQATVGEERTRATALIAQGQYARAYAVLRRAWADRQDQRLLSVAQQALALDQATAQEVRADGLPLQQQLICCLDDCRWDEARALLNRLLRDVLLAAVFSPQAGWETVTAQIQQGVEADIVAATTLTRAVRAVDQERPRDALDLLAGIETRVLECTRQMEILQARASALALLVAQGETSPAALDAVRAQLQALRAQRTQEALESLETVLLIDGTRPRKE